MHVVTYVDGDTFGDQDALLNENRDAKCMALTECELYSINIEVLQELLAKSPIMKRRMLQSARDKRLSHSTIIKRVEK